MEELDKTIEYICGRIQAMDEFDGIPEGHLMVELAKALAELVSAKAKLINCRILERQ